MLDNQFQRLSDDDMVSLTHEAHIINSLKNFQNREFYHTLRPLLRLTNAEQPNYHWFGDGVEARLLKAHTSSSGWLVGRARLGLAFQPAQLEVAVEPSSAYWPNDDDMLEITDELARLTTRKSSLISEIAFSIRQKLSMNEPSQSRYYWLDRGIECKVLKASGEVSGWQPGLIRLQFEFIPTSKQSMSENAAVIQPGLDSLRQLAVN
jgi:hypothetical protein